MTLNKALAVLMEAASRDARGAGCGIRAIANDEQRAALSEAWAVAFRRVYKREPEYNEYLNAGMDGPQ